jgi:hypothetical protein
MNSSCIAKTLSDESDLPISEKLKKALDEEEQKLTAVVGFAELQAFYNEMQAKGLVLKQRYSLPQLDTIGRTIYHRVKSI